jgi:YVTN family beta-propeller protein
VYVANAGANDVSVIDETSDQVVDTVPVGSSPDGVGVDTATGNAYVANENDDTVSVISPSPATPAVMTNPVSQSTTTGSTLTFTAAASGTPTPTVQWQVSVDGGNTWFNIQGATSTTYTTGALNPFVSAWKVRAVFTNSVGTATTNAATITVTPTTAVGIPSNDASLSGSTFFDASASPGVASVVYELSGASLSDAVVATATPTIYGWLASWNSTYVPNGTYALQSVASYANGVSDTSPGITVTVNNPPPTAFVGIPSNGAVQSGNEWLDAGASAGVTSVNYILSGGPNNLVDTVISGSTPTYFGWIGAWNTTTVPDGTYTLQSVASYAGGVTGTSSPITITVAN